MGTKGGRPISESQALLKIAGLCARQEVCLSEARDKLRRLGLGEEATERVIDRLVRESYIDEMRYARAYANDKARFSGWGRIKIKMMLYAKHVDRVAIESALEGIDHDIYAQSLLKRAQAAAKGLDLDDVKSRSKVYRRLVSRGYETVFVSTVIAQLRAERNEE